MIIAIFAVDEEGGMGLNGSMPWPSNKEDMQWFKSTTINHIVVMGKKTWDSTGMPKPLPNRTNIVFTHKKINIKLQNVYKISGDVCTNLQQLQTQYPDKNIFVIGGSDLLVQAKPVIEKIFITRIPGNYFCDVILNVDSYIENFKLINQTVLDTCLIEEYERISNCT